MCLALISSTMLGLANVDTSPNSSYWPAAILRKILLMIFPDRVFGKPGTIWIELRMMVVMLVVSKTYQENIWYSKGSNHFPN